MEQQIKIANINQDQEIETAKQALVRLVKATEKRLLKENKLTRLVIGSAVIMTTCPEKYNTLICY